MVCERC
nr:BLTX383 [Nephila pilipes]